MEASVGLRNIMRAESTESNDSSGGRRQSMGEQIGEPSSSGRRLSFSEMILGSPGRGGFSWGQGLLERKMSTDEDRKNSITNEERFKELLKRETQILNDEGTFSRKNYMKNLSPSCNSNPAQPLKNEHADLVHRDPNWIEWYEFLFSRTHEM